MADNIAIIFVINISLYKLEYCIISNYIEPIAIINTNKKYKNVRLLFRKIY